MGLKPYTVSVTVPGPGIEAIYRSPFQGTSCSLQNGIFAICLSCPFTGISAVGGIRPVLQHGFRSDAPRLLIFLTRGRRL
jgi:hypothetical protein